MEKTVFGFTVVERADFPDDLVALITPDERERMRKAMSERLDLLIRAAITPMPPQEPTVYRWPPEPPFYRPSDPRTWPTPA